MSNAYTSKIALERAKSYFDSARNYSILVDEAEVGKIRTGKNVEIIVPPGNHVIRLKIDWCGSNKISFTVKAEENVKFECGPNVAGFKAFLALPYITIWRDEYLWLKKI